MIRLAEPSIDSEDLAAVSAVLRSGLLVQGRHVAAFESAVAARVGTAHAVAVSSGTAALHLALLALGVGPGDEVAVPCYSWPATANVVVRVGAEPVFVDIDFSTRNLDAGCFARALSEHPKIKVVMPVHAFGLIADMADIVSLANHHSVSIIEDAACALGAALRGRSAGAWGNVACFSFHPRKVVTTGEGGMLTTDDADLDARLRELRSHGFNSGLGDFTTAGLNYRMTDFQGALGSSQLRKLDAFLERRRQLAGRYAGLLRGLNLELPVAVERESNTFQSYVILLPKSLAPSRAFLIAEMRRAGVEVAIGTHHIPLTGYFRQRSAHRPGEFPVTDDVAARALALPMHHHLGEEDQDLVVTTLRHVMTHHS